MQRETKGRVRGLYIPDAVQSYLVLHMNKPPFQDARVRRAVLLAVDRQELVKIVRCVDSFGCFGSVGTFLPNKGGKIVESPEDLAQAKGWRQPKDQDIAEAKALMAAAGYANGFKATLTVANVPLTVRTTEVLAEQLRKSLGIDLTIEPVDRATHVDRIIRGTHHASIDSSGVIILDPADYLNQHFLVVGGQKNPDSWKHPRLTEIMQAQARELDPAKRLRLPLAHLDREQPARRQELRRVVEQRAHRLCEVAAVLEHERGHAQQMGDVRHAAPALAHLGLVDLGRVHERSLCCIHARFCAAGEVLRLSYQAPRPCEAELVAQLGEDPNRRFCNRDQLLRGDVRPRRVGPGEKP